MNLSYLTVIKASKDHKSSEVFNFSEEFLSKKPYSL